MMKRQRVQYLEFNVHLQTGGGIEAAERPGPSRFMWTLGVTAMAIRRQWDGITLVGTAK